MTVITHDLLMNGAYIGSKTVLDVQTLAQSMAGAIVVGSITVEPRPSKGYWQQEGSYALNSFGLPNDGIEYYKKFLPEMVVVAHLHSKSLIANLVGFTKQEFVELIKVAEDSGADTAELNFGCPNIQDEQEDIIAYHPERIREILAFIKEHKPKIRLSVKLSPLPPHTLRETAKLIEESGIVSSVVATNSYPNATSGEQLAGLTGSALKPISLGMVTQLRDLLPRYIDIIGCGGVASGEDVTDYLEAGASAVQIVTALMEDGPSIFEKILFQLKKQET